MDEAAAEIVAVVTNPIRLRAMRNEAVSLNLPALVQKFSYGSSLASSRAAFSDLLVPVRSALMNHWRGQSFMFNESAAGSSGDNNETGLLVD